MRPQKDLKRITRIPIILGVFFFLLFMFSCSISLPPFPSPIFIGVNTESTFYDYFDMADTSLTLRFGDSWHGAINPGSTLSIYSDLPELTNGGHLQVYCPHAGAEGLPNIGYYNADQYPAQTAALIRDYYLNIQPTTSILQIRQMTVSWSNLGTEFPIYNIVIPTGLPGGDGTLYHIQLAGAYAVGVPPIRTVDSSGNVVNKMDPEGRTLIIRKGDNSPQPGIVSTNMSSSLYSPTHGVSTTGFQPQITTDKPLAYMAALLIPTTTTSNCYNGEPLKGRITATQDAVTGYWTYTFYPTSPLYPNTCYVYAVATSAPFSRYGGPPQMLTQGMGATTVTDYTGAFDLDLSMLQCHSTPSGVVVWPYYFCTGNDPGVSIQLGQLFTQPIVQEIPASVKIVPRVMMQNTGTFTAFVSFPSGFAITSVTQVWANGAPATMINFQDTEDSNSMICKFNRSDIVQYFGPNGRLFVVYGRTSDGNVFIGYDTIQRCMVQDNPEQDCD
ncbi:MAG: hypothetical protein ACPL1H_08630 [bacterium]